MTVIQRIRRQYEGMSGVERRIADVILREPVQVTNMTIAHLADLAGVSEGSVVNFCNHVGVRGFSALKIALASETKGFEGFSFGSVTAADTPWTALRKVTGNAVETFQRTSRLLREEDLQAAADRLLSARQIHIYGAGDSALMAQDACLHFMRIGLPAYAVTDYLSLEVAASQLDGGCTALAVSHFGQTMEIVDAMATARQRGAATICVTSFADSALRNLCDIALVVSSIEAERHQEAAVSRLAHLLVLDGLCAYISAQKGQEAMERLDQVELRFARHRYQR